MGTNYNVTLVFNEPKSSIYLEGVHQRVEVELQLVDSLMSTYKPFSDVSQFNNLGVDQAIEISIDTLKVISFAKRLNKLTDGYFDITVGPLVDLWGFGAKSKSLAQVPSHNDVSQVATLVGSDNFLLKDNALIKSAAVNIDLSALAKGYAVDKVSEALLEVGVRNSLVEVGGEVNGQGVNFRGVPWILGIELPSALGRKAHSTLNLIDMSLATSGDYRNFYEYEGQKYSHTIDPKTARPVRHKLASVSVLSESCMKSDALATALMAMGEVKGYEFATSQGVSAFFIYRKDNGFSSKSSGDFDQYLN